MNKQHPSRTPSYIKDIVSDGKQEMQGVKSNVKESNVSGQQSHREKHMAVRTGSLPGQLTHTDWEPGRGPGWGTAGMHVSMLGCERGLPWASCMKSGNSMCSCHPWSFCLGSCLGMFDLVPLTKSGHTAKPRVNEADVGVPQGGCKKEMHCRYFPNNRPHHPQAQNEFSLCCMPCTQTRWPARDKQNNRACRRSGENICLIWGSAEFSSSSAQKVLILKGKYG